MKQTDPQLKFRLPPDLMEKVRAAAEQARRPVSSEIIDRLEMAYRPSNLQIHKKGEGPTARLAALEIRVAELTDLCTKLAKRVDVKP